MGLYKDPGKENGDYHHGLYRDYKVYIEGHFTKKFARKQSEGISKLRLSTLNPLSDLILRGLFLTRRKASPWGGPLSAIFQTPPPGTRDNIQYEPRRRPLVLVRWHGAARVGLFSPADAQLPEDDGL